MRNEAFHISLFVLLYTCFRTIVQIITSFVSQSRCCYFSSSSSSIILWGSCCLSLHGLVLQLNASRILLFLFIHIASSRVPLVFGISPIFLRYIEITISTHVRSLVKVFLLASLFALLFFSNRRTLIRHVSLLLRLNEGDANLHIEV
jgi:hypothetical protein